MSPKIQGSVLIPNRPLQTPMLAATSLVVVTRGLLGLVVVIGQL